VLRLMFEGETSIVRLTARHGYGSEGCEELSVPPDENLEYEIKLISIGSLRVKPHEMSQKELLDDCKEYQDKAKIHFKKKNYGEAERLYTKALVFANSIDDDNGMEIKIRCLNNVATVEFMMDKMKESQAACDSVLRLDSENPKALFRMGLIFETRTEYVLSLQYLQRTLKCLTSSSSSFADEKLCKRTNKAIKRVKKSRDKYRAAKKKFSEAMLRRRRHDADRDISRTTSSTTTSSSKESSTAKKLKKEEKQPQQSAYSYFFIIVMLLLLLLCILFVGFAATMYF